MIARRAFVAIATAAICSTNIHAAGILSGALEWFQKITSLTPKVLDDIYNWILSAKGDYRTLTDSKAALDDIRRKLADPSIEVGLRSKLAAWLRRYDEISKENASDGEARPTFFARQQREVALLSKEWDSIKTDAVAALDQIARLQAEIKSLDPDVITSDEFRIFQNLIQSKKEKEDFLNMDAPTDPYQIDRLRDCAKSLDETIGIIDARSGELAQLIKKKG